MPQNQSITFIYIMDLQNNDNEFYDNELDIKLDKPKSSRFLFLLGFFGIFIFAWAGCFNVYQHRFENTAKDIDKYTTPSSKLNPEYK